MKKGRVITIEARTQSPIVILKDYARVGLLDVFDNIVAWTLISKKDVGLVDGKKLRCDKGNYAVFFGNRKNTDYLHRRIVVTTLEVDHINGNGLDNRRTNLREATHQQNNANKFRGMTRGIRKKGNKYEAYSSEMVNGKSNFKYLGMHSSLEEAMRVRDSYAKQLYGDFAILNIQE